MIAPAHPDSAPSGLRPGGGIRFACFDWGEYEYEYTHRYVEKDLPATYVNQPNWLQRRRSHQLSTVRRAEKVGKSSRKCCMGSRRAFYEQIMEKIMRSPAMWHEKESNMTPVTFDSFEDVCLTFLIGYISFFTCIAQNTVLFWVPHTSLLFVAPSLYSSTFY